MKKTTYSNPSVDCFWLSTKFYMVPGLLRFYKDRVVQHYKSPKDVAYDPTGIITAYCNEISTITIFENGVVCYKFNGRPALEEHQNSKGIQALENLLRHLGWRSVISYWSQDDIYNEK